VRDFVRAKPGCNNPHRLALGKSSDHTQRFQLVFDRKTVAALDLERRRSVGSQLANALKGKRVELVLAAQPKIANRCVNASPPLRDLHVVETLGALFVLLEPRLAKHCVRMGIDQAGSENAAAAVNDFGIPIGVFEIARRADHRDPSVADGDGSAFQNTGVAHLLSLSRSGRTRASHNLSGVHEEQILQATFLTRGT
jgi:hypothetical protein